MSANQDKVNELLLAEIDNLKELTNYIFEQLVEKINQQQEQIDHLSHLIINPPWDE